MRTLKEIKDRYKECFGIKRLTEKIEYYDKDIMIVSFNPIRYAFDKNFKRVKLKSRFKVYHVMSLSDFSLLDELNEQKHEMPIIITANYIHRIKRENNIIGGIKPQIKQ